MPVARMVLEVMRSSCFGRVFYDWDVFEVSIQGDQHPTCSSTTRATLYGLESGAEATLEGRYLAIEGDGRVLLWDWVDNLWGTIPRYLRRLESTPSLVSSRSYHI